MSEVLDAVKQACDLLAFVAGVDRGALADADLVGLLAAEAAMGRLLEASEVITAGEVVVRSRHELGKDGLSFRFGERKPVNFIEQITRVSAAVAVKRVRVGAAIRPRVSLLGERLPAERPILAAAVAAGRIGVDAASSIVFHLKQAASGSAASAENMDAAETSLVGIAALESVDLVADAGRQWRDALDPDGIEPRYEDLVERQSMFVGRERNGITKYTINAAPILAARMNAILEDSMDKTAGPRFLSDEDRANATTETVDQGGRQVQVVTDPRSAERRRAEILSGVLDIALRASRHGHPDHRTVGSVTAVIRLADLLSGTGFGIVEGIDEIIPAKVIQALACETGFTPVIVGNLGQPLYEGPLVRCATKAQRTALIARDGDRCIAHGCRRTASQSHAHHVIFHSNGGPTDIDDLVMLCPAHHGALHNGSFEIRMNNGMPYLRSAIDGGDDYAWRPASRNRLTLRPPP